MLVLASQLVPAYFSSKSPIREFATAEPIQLEISFQFHYTQHCGRTSHLEFGRLGSALLLHSSGIFIV